jgi:hypothetical protein
MRPERTYFLAKSRIMKRQGRRRQQRRSSENSAGFAPLVTNSNVDTLRLRTRELVSLNTFFPTRWRGEMLYREQSGIAAPNTNVSSNPYIWQLNGINPCNLSTAAGTPIFFADIAPNYASYIIRKTKVRIECFDPSQDGMCVIVAVNGPGSAGATFSALLQSRQRIYWQTISNTGQQRCQFLLDVDHPPVIGRTPAAYDADAWSAVTTNPTVPYLTAVQVWGISQVPGTASNCNIVVSIQYMVEFFDLLV